MDFSNAEYIDNNKGLADTNAKVTALRRLINDNIYSITIMLVNDADGEKKATQCLLQPEIIVSTESNQFRFKDYNQLNDISGLNDEEQSLALQYRNKMMYATGLGTSVDWTIDESGNGTIRNDFFPMNEVPSMDFKLPANSNVPEQTLSMKYLSDLDKTDKSEKIEALSAFVDLYCHWISQMDEKLSLIHIFQSAIAYCTMELSKKSKVF